MMNHLYRSMGRAVLTLAVAVGFSGAAVAGDPPLACATGFLDFTGAQVVPATKSTGTGQALYEIDTVNNKLYSLVLISPEGTETSAGLYTGAAGANGTLVTALPSDPIKFWTYAYDEAIEADLLSGNAYIQLASDTYPNGEVRAQFPVGTACAPNEPCYNFDFTLDGDQVTPGPVTTNASGTVHLALDTASLTITYDVTLTDVVNETSTIIEGYHFPGQPATGAILQELPLGSPKTGSFQITADQLFYVKLGAVRVTVKTMANPTGEIGAPFPGPQPCFTPSPTETPETPSPTPTETPTETPSPTPSVDYRALGDFDSSGCTDLTDFLFMLDFWQSTSPIGGDVIGLSDFLALLDFWNSGPNC